MALITWSDRMSVGVERIDKQHRALIDLLNTLHAEMLAGRGIDALGEILGEVVQYTKTHFATEEMLFRSYNYPKLAEHKKEHDDLAKKAVDLLTGVSTGKVVLTLPTMNFLKDWLTNHILKTDMAYRSFFVEKGVK
jgi:hemerythrin